MSLLPFAPFDSSRRRAMWRELEVMWTNQPAARARRAEMEREHDLGIPYDEEHFPRRSPEPDPTP